MREWRDKGFVPDSDDEENTHISLETVSPASQPNGREIHKQRPSVTSVIVEIPARNGTFEDVGHAESSESELTELAQSPETQVPANSEKRKSFFGRPLPTKIKSHPSSELGATSTRPSSRDHHFSLPDSLCAAENQISNVPDAHSTFGGKHHVAASALSSSIAVPDDTVDVDHVSQRQRNFRKRNEIQLHPYLLEQRRFEKDIQARGLKPFRVRNEVSRHEEIPQPLETVQRGNSVSSSQSSIVSRTLESSDLASHVHAQNGFSSSPPFEAETGRSNEDDTELPDVGTLLQAEPKDKLQLGPKRRRLTYSKKAQKTKFQPSHVYATTQKDNAHLSREQVYDFPRSQNDSPDESAAQLHQENRFRYPPGFSPALPTPARSSQSKGPAAVTPEASESDEAPRTAIRSVGRQARRNPIIIPSSESSSSEADLSSNSGSRVSSRIRQIQRKIKGVLPASWLRLDLQAQAQRKTPEDRKSRDEHAARPETSKGVAKRIRRSTAASSPSATNFIELLSSVSEGDQHSMDQPRPSVMQQVDQGDGSTRARPLLDTQNLDDIEEDDWIDPMLPSRPRPPGLKRRRKRQTKLTDAFDVSKRQHSLPFAGPARSKIYRDQEERSLRHSKASRKRRPEVSYLSILDVDGGSHEEEIPPFVRLAERAARKREDKGRSSPSQKFIRLQTRADTEDANEPLRRWREGTLKPRNNVHAQAASGTVRQPLAPRSSNEQKRLPSTGKLYAPRNSGDANRQTLAQKIKLTRTHRSQLRQTKLAPVDLTKHPDASSLSEAEQTKPPSQPAARPAKHRVLTNGRSVRDAQLEALECEFDQNHHRVAFQRYLQELEARSADVQSTERLDDHFETSSSRVVKQPAPAARSPKKAQEHAQHPPSIQAPTHRSLARRPRKLPAQRLDVETTEFRQPSEPSPMSDVSVVDLVTNDNEETSDKPSLLGLGPYGTRYPVDFDIRRLEPGTFFHESTFIGSGDVQKCLQSKKRDMDVAARPFSIRVVDREVHWQCWNEDVAADISVIFDSLKQNIGKEMVSNHCLDHSADAAWITFRNMLLYFATYLGFSDPIDRRPFLECLTKHVENAVDEILSLSPAGQSQGILPTLSLLLVLCLQLTHVANQTAERHVFTARLLSLVRSLSEQVMHYIVSHGASGFQRFYEANRRHKEREAGINNDPVIQSIIVLRVVLREAQIPKCSFWDFFNRDIATLIANAVHVQTLDDVWAQMISILPIFEFDDAGLLKANALFEEPFQNWALVKQILERLFLLSGNTAERGTSTLNSYLRANLTRCYHLQKSWRWRRSELLLGTIFDFFAQKGLSGLKLEDSSTSPRFLEELHQEPSLCIQPLDKAFHIFLKLLAKSLLHMREEYADKKIQGIAWRFVPNHGRTYPKDESLRQEDLDSLRNHHDLLCVLYWASPAGFRPRLDLIRNLVDHSASHREACRLNVRAWSNLIRFQVSTDEDVAALEPLTEWFRDIVKQTVAQYRLARSEAEAQQDCAQAQGNSNLTNDFIHSVMERNQRQVLATLSDAITGLLSAVNVARSVFVATALLRETDIYDVFSLLDNGTTRANTVITEVLGVIRTYLQRVHREEAVSKTQGNDESQDYGDWPDMEEADTPPIPKIDPLDLDFISAPLDQLLSNCFGMEMAPDDKLLLPLVETWAQTADTLVQKRQQDWNSYLDSYGSYSWTRLRNTEQTRKYGPLYYSSVLEADPRAFQDHQQTFISVWLISLAERESTLKFQHRITTALLNADVQHPLLKNLPFTSSTTGKFDVSLHDLRERRLALLSSILSNMRDAYEFTISSRERNELRASFTELLKLFMAAMKSNYIALQQGDTIRGSYVAFVQRVVEFLQQYTTEICSIDKFFTDSSAFPLPATDPTYVVGKLKGYALKLKDLKTQKNLAMFIQNVSERAAADNQQAYLVGQLHTAMTAFREDGDEERPTLLSVLIRGIFPAYLQFCMSTACGWIPAVPVLQATTRVWRDILYQFGLNDQQAIPSVSCMLSEFVSAILSVSQLLVDHSGLLEQPQILHVLTFIIEAVTAALPAVDYLQRAGGQAQDLLQTVEFLRQIADFVQQVISGHQGATAPYMVGDDAVVSDSRLDPVREFCIRQLSDALKSTWAQEGNRFFVGRMNMKKEVLIDLRTIDEERDRVLHAVQDFDRMLEALPALRSGTPIARRKNGLGLRGIIV